MADVLHIGHLDDGTYNVLDEGVGLAVDVRGSRRGTFIMICFVLFLCVEGELRRIGLSASEAGLAQAV